MWRKLVAVCLVALAMQACAFPSLGKARPTPDATRLRSAKRQNTPTPINAFPLAASMVVVTPTATPPIIFDDFSSSDGLFSMKYPRSWFVGEGEEFGVIFSESRTMAHGGTKLEEAATLLILFRENGLEDTPPQEMLHLLLSEFQTNWKKTQISEVESFSIDGEAAARVLVKGLDKDSGLNFTMYMVVMAHQTLGGLWLAIAPQERWDETWPVFDEMLTSFRFLEAKPTPSSPQEPVLEMSLGQSGAGEGEFKSPSSLAIDDQGHIYVADYGHNRVQKFDPQGKYLWELEGFEQVRAVAVDGRGNLYVLDQEAAVVKKYNSEGTLLFPFGSASKMQSPSDLAVDKEGKVYVTDTGHRHVQIFDSWGRPLQTFDGLASGEEHLVRPWGIALDGQGNVYVTDVATMKVYIFNAEGNLVHRFGGSSQFDRPKGIAVDEMGRIYVADTGHNRLQVFFALGESLLYELGSGASAPEERMGKPEAVALDEQGNLYVADTGHDRVQKFRLQTSQDLLTNGDFATELKGWQQWSEPASELREDSVKVAEGDETHPHILEIQREKTGYGGFYTLGGVGAYQVLDVNVRAYSSLILKAEVKVIKQDGSNIAHWDKGRQPEGALMIRLQYQDSTGKIGEWYHGFYSGEVKEADAQRFTLVPHEKWFSYTSSNLVTEIPDLVTLKELRIYGFGWDFASQLSDIRLIAQP